jgi:hypothetical protein
MDPQAIKIAFQKPRPVVGFFERSGRNTRLLPACPELSATDSYQQGSTVTPSGASSHGAATCFTGFLHKK